MISYQLSTSKNVGPWDTEQLHYLPAALLKCLATRPAGSTVRSWTRICGCLYNKLRGLGTFERHGDNADRLSVLCHTHNCCLALCRTEAPGQECRAFTSLTAPSWALISDSLMLSGSQTVQSGVQRKETEASQRETNTQRRFWVLVKTNCMTNAVTFQSVQEHHRLRALMVTGLKGYFLKWADMKRNTEGVVVDAAD